jgi:hypothetical protein
VVEASLTVSATAGLWIEFSAIWSTFWDTPDCEQRDSSILDPPLTSKAGSRFSRIGIGKVAEPKLEGPTLAKEFPVNCLSSRTKSASLRSLGNPRQDCYHKPFRSLLWADYSSAAVSLACHHQVLMAKNI